MSKRVVVPVILALVGLAVVDCSHPATSTPGTGQGGAGGTSPGNGGGGVSNGGNTTASTNVTCSAGQTACGSDCADFNTNNKYCGSCTNACATGETCQAGSCKCATDTDKCGGSTCLDLKTDSAHCGSCTNACATGQICAAGACSCTISGQKACSGACIDIQTDENNCGDCNTKCTAVETCTAGSCVCQSGYTKCGTTCTDTKSDPNNCSASGACGTKCATGEVCNAGTCSTTCGTGLKQCGSSCVDTKTSSLHCSDCDKPCASGQTCSNSACSCATGEESCGGSCVTTASYKTDASNCGSCGNKCGTGKSCTNGTCSCPTGQTDCSGTCVDTNTSTANCGKCGTACKAGENCSAGACSCPTAGDVLCNGTCVNPSTYSTDANNCGSCGNKCASGATCEGGTCKGGGSTCSDTTFTTYYKPYDGSYNAAAKSAVDAMSVADRLLQMQGITTVNGTGQNWVDTFRSANASSTTGMYGFQFRDGPRGVNLDAPLANATGAVGTDKVSGTPPTGGKSTVFPVAMARGASFDLDLEYKIGQAMGDEMVAAKQTMMLAPTVNILRHPFWGRAQETYGEDVYALGRIGTAYTIGIQEYVPACVKHYAANNIENGRETLTVSMDDKTLHDTFGRHFDMIINDGGVACVMAAYDTIQVTGTPSYAAKKCTQNKHLLTDILRTDFGFKGMVLSDWWAMPNGSKQSPTATDTLRPLAAEAVAAGLDMELPWAMYYAQLGNILDATSGATVSTTQVKTAATRIVEQKLRFKVDKANGPYGLKAATTTYSGGTISNNQSHIDLAYQAALEGSVLLKNDNNTLPFASTVKKVAVIGADAKCSTSVSGTATACNVKFATEIRTGDIGSSRVTPTSGSIAPFDGIKNQAPSGSTVTSSTAASAAAGQDAVVVVVGLTAHDEGEEYTGAGDRSSCALDAKDANGQAKLITDAVTAAAGKPVIVILEGGSVIDIEPWLSQVQAVIMGWYPGMVGGKAFGDLLWGKANFSGKLPITWPKNCATDEPGFSASTTQGYDIGYRYFDKNGITPRYFFGHGLSYSTFEYSNAQSPCNAATKDGVITLNVTVKNTGTVTGDEVVYAFASYPGNSGRPIKELKGFTREAEITAGESRTVSIKVRASDLKYWNGSAWTVDTGNVDFLIGPSADSTKLLKVTVPIQ